MRLNIPRPEPRKDGDYQTYVTIGYGDPHGTIHLAEGSALDLNFVSVEDCDRLTRAAAEVKDKILGYQARAAAPHGRKNIYQGTCQLCGKPEGDELHAGPDDPARLRLDAGEGTRELGGPGRELLTEAIAEQDEADQAAGQ